MAYEYDPLSECRAAIGVTEDAFDGQIQLAIAAARQKMQLGGVSETKANDNTDSLVMVAIICYVKGTVGNDNPDAPRYLESFESRVTQMKCTDAYTKEATDEQVA